MKRCRFLFGLTLLLLSGRPSMLLAQLPGWELMETADKEYRDGDRAKAITLARQCIQEYPVAVRNNFSSVLIMEALDSPDSLYYASAKAFRSIANAYHKDSFHMDGQLITSYLAAYPWSREFLTVKRLQAGIHLQQGDTVEGKRILQDVVAECLASPQPSRAGFWAVTELAELEFKQGDYAGCIAHARLALNKLFEQRFCSRASSHTYIPVTLLGLGYSGMGQSDSALHYLSRLLMLEEPYSTVDPIRGLDSLIALMQRLDTTTPVTEQLDSAIAQVSHTVKLYYQNGDIKIYRWRCTVVLAGREMVVWEDDISRIYYDQLEPVFDGEWPYPFSKASCQAMLRRSPLYRRAHGESAAEIFPPSR